MPPESTIPRAIQPLVRRALDGPRRVIVLYGPRQVGKTTLLRRVAADLPGRVLTLNGDWLDDQVRLRPERAALSRLGAGVYYLLVDEAQNIPDIGTCLKLVHDHFPSVRVLATGSSSFDLARRTGEPLTGRQRTFRLYPIAYCELGPDLLSSRTLL